MNKNLYSFRTAPTLLTMLLIVASMMFAGTAWGQTNYYSKSTGNLEITTNWGTNTDGSGSNPSNFTTASCIYNIRNRAAATIGNSRNNPVSVQKQFLATKKPPLLTIHPEIAFHL